MTNTTPFMQFGERIPNLGIRLLTVHALREAFLLLDALNRAYRSEPFDPANFLIQHDEEPQGAQVFGLIFVSMGLVARALTYEPKATSNLSLVEQLDLPAHKVDLRFLIPLLFTVAHEYHHWVCHLDQRSVPDNA